MTNCPERVRWYRPRRVSKVQTRATRRAPFENVREQVAMFSTSGMFRSRKSRTSGWISNTLDPSRPCVKIESKTPTNLPAMLPRSRVSHLKIDFELNNRSHFKFDRRTYPPIFGGEEHEYDVSLTPAQFLYPDLKSRKSLKSP